MRILLEKTISYIFVNKQSTKSEEVNSLFQILYDYSKNKTISDQVNNYVFDNFPDSIRNFFSKLNADKVQNLFNLFHHLSEGLHYNDKTKQKVLYLPLKYKKLASILNDLLVLYGEGFSIKFYNL